jgi:hypothetical protein
MIAMTRTLSESLSLFPRGLVPRCIGSSGSLLALLGIVSGSSVAEAQDAGAAGSRSELDSHLPASSETSNPTIDSMYGGVTIAGQNTQEEDGETNFGLSRMYGGVSGSASLQGEESSRPTKSLPQFHVVKKGDTLWDLSESFYDNPWAWPQLWSFNPQIENPHWIYPGDQVRTAGKRNASRGPSEDNSAGRGGFVGRSQAVESGTVFVRDQGYIGDAERDVWGEIAGAHHDNMLLSDGNVVYLVMKEGVDLRIGQRLTVFKEIAEAPNVPNARRPPGEIVKIYGTVRVDGWDQENRIARGSLIESLDIIERGFKVGPVGRRFDVVPPIPATVEVTARILTSLYPHVYFGKDQLVFIDKGSEDGLKPGNRLRALRRGDTWRRKLKTADYHARMRLELNAPDMPKPEVTPLRGDDEKFPDEVVGEITVLRAEEYSAICLVTASSWGLESGERVVAVPGY